MNQAPRNGTYLVCVSGQEESTVALRYACLRAKRRQSNVALLHVIEPVSFQGLQSVTDKMREERQAEAQQLLQQMATVAHSTTGTMPQLILKEGVLGDQIVKTARELEEVNILVLGHKQNSEASAKLVPWLTAQLGTELQMPLILVPGNLSDEQLQKLI
jgi:nucleotide-binding universal stress UspA family protein